MLTMLTRGRTRPIRVLYVIDSLGSGGAERSLVDLLPALPASRVEPTVACLVRRPEGWHQEALDKGFIVDLVGGRSRASSVFRLRRLIRRLRPDIVHTTLFESDIVGRLAAVGTGAKVVSTLVNTAYDGAPAVNPQIAPWKHRLVRSLDGVTARHLTDHFQAITAAAGDSARRNLGVAADKITQIGRGRDPGRLGARTGQRRDAVRARLGIARDALLIVNVGRQEYQKGQLTLLRAARELVRRHDNVQVLVLGRPGAASAELTRLVSDLELEGHVRLLGHVADAPDILAAADVFAFPSYYEGLGGALLEAMALGLPSVVSRIPAVLEVVEEDGSALVVPAGEVDVLAEALDRLLEDLPLREKLGARACEIFAERFDLKECADQTVAMYERLLGSRVT